MSGVHTARTAEEAIEAMADEALRPKRIQPMLFIDGRPATKDELAELQQMRAEQEAALERIAQVRQQGEFWVQVIAELDERARHIIT